MFLGRITLSPVECYSVHISRAFQHFLNDESQKRRQRSRAHQSHSVDAY